MTQRMETQGPLRERDVDSREEFLEILFGVGRLGAARASARSIGARRAGGEAA